MLPFALIQKSVERGRKRKKARTGGSEGASEGGVILTGHREEVGRGGEGGRKNDRFCHVGLHGIEIKRRCAVNVLSNFLGLTASLDTVC